ncbi:hypothetical protein VP1G_11282 [Cytospora mali]|uniref:Uncharacterized protein n=1 Tax=Cytospora mali TaxID=578113 RepID=A0A194VAY7_CYTMA|nr:hypothetical protein VP1G_11282 [Valsa mali var. pyri (nom. inval.)]
MWTVLGCDIVGSALRIIDINARRSKLTTTSKKLVNLSRAGTIITRAYHKIAALPATVFPEASAKDKSKRERSQDRPLPQEQAGTAISAGPGTLGTRRGLVDVHQNQLQGKSGSQQSRQASRR